MKNDELTVHTPLGELVVGIKEDPDYPGISVAFRGEGMNDFFNEGLIRLAWIEYSPEKRRLQAIVYGDGNADAPLAPFEKWIERIAIFRWDRTYPADRYFDLQLGSGQWHLVGTSEFAGHSHDLITMEVYER